MKKSLLGLAVLSSIAGAAAAQSNVTIYGVADAGFEYSKGVTTEEKTLRLQSGQQSGSRIGFRGTEDLGGGLSAIFTLESGFNIDDGSIGSKLFSRQAYVGLNSGFGSVKLGRQQTPLYYALLDVDPFSINLAGGAQRIFGAGLYGADPLFRADNAVTYTTPNFAGLSGTALYAFGEQAGDTTLGRQVSLGLAYGNGPVNVRVVYHKGNDVSAASTIGAAFPGTAFGGALAATDLRTTFVGATYDVGVVKAHLGFGDSRADVAGDEFKNRNYLVGLSAPVGTGTVLASWIRNDVRDIDEGKTDQFAIGYTHPLSKRTNLYTSFGYTKNDDAVALRAFEEGESSRVFNVGLRHTF